MAIEMRPNPLPEDEHTFWQKLILPEEERRWIRDWEGGYRWFRSPNVIQLERYRGRGEMAKIRDRLLRK
jgi:hypothetical protein